MRYIYTVVAIMWVSAAVAMRPSRSFDYGLKPMLIEVPDFDMVQFVPSNRLPTWQWKEMNRINKRNGNRRVNCLFSPMQCVLYKRYQQNFERESQFLPQNYYYRI